MARKPIIRNWVSGTCCICCSHFFNLSGHARYGNPSTIKTSPKRHNNNFI